LWIIDGYQFSPSYVRAMHAGGGFVCLVDDVFSAADGCHALLNGNLYADEALYPPPHPATMLLGPRYALLADPFRAARRPVRVGPATKVLVTFGGSDATGQSRNVLAAVPLVDPSLPALDVCVVLGGANPRALVDELEGLVPAGGPHSVTIAYAVTDMAARMAWADVAVTAAGGTCLELACVGVPALVVPVADNQRRVAEACESLGLMRSLGWYEGVTPEGLARALDDLRRDAPLRASMVSSQHRLVDGEGKTRVARALSAAHAAWASGSSRGVGRGTSTW
jgi:UDP-2,4-diacetamido-2,4,6-trideoxy-beta-L-altropyranose hydrolase